MKTSEEIADEILADVVEGDYAFAAKPWIVKAIEADREQRHEIFIAQNDGGDVVGVFFDADEATAAYPHGPYYSVVEETVWEPGDYAAMRIQELTEGWETSTGDTASDYALSEDDWAFGLDEDEAAEIVRLIEWKEGRR
jgi:hypothetical protein